jgi:hypothetical protein
VTSIEPFCIAIPQQELDDFANGSNGPGGGRLQSPARPSTDVASLMWHRWA